MKSSLLCLLLCIFTASAQLDWAKLQVKEVAVPVLKTFNDTSNYVIGGSVAAQYQFPYQAALGLDGYGFCGGSLISRSVVLTAAHCVDGVEQFSVRLGYHNIQADCGEPTRVVFTTTHKIQHEGYNTDTINNDIALLVLPWPVTFNAGIGLLSLPRWSQTETSFVSRATRVSGWGRTSDASPGVSPQLRYADLTVINQTECATAFGSLITGSKICTRGGVRGTCNGDSGGPLVLIESSNVTTILGIVSFGSRFCESNAPSVFTRVTSYLAWLRDNANITISN